jgi:uncharacterized damage-inducible protein DinB
MDLLDRLLGHDRWTTAHLLELSSGLTDAQLDQEFDIGHRTFRATFVHIIPNPGFWTGLMTGQPATYRESIDGGVAELLERHERVYDQFASFARRMRDEQRLDETFRDHWNYPQSAGGTILQVILHNQQHRAEILHMLQRLGITDLPDGDVQEWEHKIGIIT